MKVRLGKKFKVTLVSVLVLSLLPGCWGQKEVGEMSIMLGLGIDRLDSGQVRVTAQVVDPSAIGGGPSSGAATSGGGGGQAYLNHQSTGKTLDEAMAHFHEKPWRPIFVAHNTIVVFGEDYAKQGLDEAIDYFDRHKDFRRIQMFAIAKECCALDVLNAKPGVEKISARSVRELIDHQVERGASVRSIELDVNNQILSPSHSPIVASVQMDEKQNIHIAGVGLFQGGKLVSYLNPEETRGLLWFLGKVERTELQIPCGKSKGGSQGSQGSQGHSTQDVSVRVLNETVHMVPQVTPQGPVMQVQVRGSAEITRLCPEGEPTVKNFPRWKEELDQEVVQEMQTSLKAVQEQDVDAVQFGTRLFQTNPAYWRKAATSWARIFPTVRVQYDVQFNILRSGMTSNFATGSYTPQAYPPEHGREESIQ